MILRTYNIDFRLLPMLLVLALGLGQLACEEEKSEVPDWYKKSSANAEASTADAKVKAEAEKKKKSGLVVPDLNESSFIANARHRDPYKVYVEVVIRQEEVKQIVQREVKLKEFDVSELRLIGIITKIGDPRAMVTTPEGTGFVLRRGDYVGRADYIDTGSGGEKIQVNWRIARIHGSGKEEERGVYLVRDDPSAPADQVVNRFMALHPKD